MSSSLLVTLEIVGVLGVILLLGGWELWQLRKAKLQDRKSQEEDKPSRLSSYLPESLDPKEVSHADPAGAAKDTSKRNGG